MIIAREKLTTRAIAVLLLLSVFTGEFTFGLGYVWFYDPDFDRASLDLTRAVVYALIGLAPAVLFFLPCLHITKALRGSSELGASCRYPFDTGN